MQFENKFRLMIRICIASIMLLISSQNVAYAQMSNDIAMSSQQSPTSSDVLSKSAQSTCIQFITEDLTSPRWNGLPNNRLQVVIWYDGTSDPSVPPELRIQYFDSGSSTYGWISIGDASDPGGQIDSFGVQIETREYDLGACELTGLVEVDGITPNGVIDGMAFGLYTKNNSGQYGLWQSHSNDFRTDSDYVGAWRNGFGDSTFATRTPQISDGIAREHARMIIKSAKLLDEGQHDIKPIAPSPVTGDPAATPNCSVQFIKEDLSSNRSSALPKNRLQATVFSDGAPSSDPTLRVEYIDPSNQGKGWITIGGSSDPGGKIDNFGTQIETREYDLDNCTLTGLVEVNGVVNDGVIDGLAFGLYTKNNSGQYQLCQSWSSTLHTRSEYVSAWPLGMSSGIFSGRTPQISNSYAREQALMAITSAKLLGNGQHYLCNNNSVALPDLVPISATFDASCKATITYENIGSADMTTQSYMSGATPSGGNIGVGWTLYPTIAAGATDTRVWNPGAGTFGSILRITVDSNNQLVESDESNNVLDFPVPSQCQNPLPTVDLIADQIEVTQAIQDLNNSVRLVQNKRTYVRFHVHSNSGIHVTTANLIAQHGSNQVTLTPLNTGGQISVQPSPDRSDIDHAFLFELPAGYRQGNVTLTGVLNPSSTPAESSAANNNVSVSVTFEPVPDQNLVLAAMGYGSTNIYPNTSHQQKLESWLEKAFPVAGYNVNYRSYYYGMGTPPLGITCSGVNAFLQVKRNMDIAGGTATIGTRYYGMVADDLGFMRGCAWINGHLSSGPTGTNTWGWDNDGSYGDWYGGHELAHNYGRRHALFCGASDSTNPTYPHPNGWISPVLSGNNAIYGFDLDTHEIYGPNWADVMTYCDNQWTSDFTYEALMDYFQNSPVVMAAGRNLAVDRLLVVGIIEPNTNDVTLEPLSIIANAAEIKQRIPGDYAIVLRNSAGNELARYPFTPDTIEVGPGLGSEGHMDMLGINELVPYVDGTVQVDIERSDAVIETIKAGPSKPNVMLEEINGGQPIDGDTIHLSWNASDADGDTLSFIIQYSPDNGTTWEVITPYMSDMSVEINTSNLEDVETALFRVVVTDGIHTNSSDSNATARYFSSSTGGKAGNVRFADEDILMLDPDSDRWSIYFDGSDVGLRNRDVDAFHILNDGNILLSLDRPRTIGDVAYDDSDIIKFTATSLGNRTRGEFTMYLDGSDVQLTKGGEDIDAIALLTNGDLIISTLGTARVTGAVARDEDMLRFRPTRLGNSTRGAWSLYLDGSDIKLSHKNEDIWAVWVDDNIQQVHLSTFKNYNAGGLKGDSDDILACDGSVGNNTRCKLSLEWNGDAYGLGSELIDGYSISPAPALTVYSALADVEDAEDETPEADDESEDMLDDDEYTEHVYLPLVNH